MQTLIRRLRVAVLAAALLLLLGACGQEAAAPASQPEPATSLYAQGEELIALMVEMVGNETYMGTFSGSETMQEMLSAAREGDYSQPQAVYAITIPETQLAALTELAGMEGASEDLQAYMQDRMQAAVISQLNAAGGAEVLAAASICTASKTFVLEGVEENILYLYTYANGLPAIVSFQPGEGGSVAATSNFLFNSDFQAEENIRQYFQEISAEMEQVTQ